MRSFIHISTPADCGLIKIAWVLITFLGIENCSKEISCTGCSILKEKGIAVTEWYIVNKSLKNRSHVCFQ